MGWKAVEREGQSEAWGKKQNKAGRWRKTKVPNYSGDPNAVTDVKVRLKELRLFEQYEKELEKLAGRAAIPEPWASAAQKSQAALKVVNRKKRLQKV